LALQNAFCSYWKRLDIVGIPAFHAGQTFLYVTEPTIHMSFPSKMEKFPVLERLDVAFHGRLSPDSNPQVVTPPHAQEAKLSPSPMREDL
jgi:hypothetical protein